MASLVRLSWMRSVSVARATAPSPQPVGRLLLLASLRRCLGLFSLLAPFSLSASGLCLNRCVSV